MRVGAIVRISEVVTSLCGAVPTQTFCGLDIEVTGQDPETLVYTGILREGKYAGCPVRLGPNLRYETVTPGAGKQLEPPSHERPPWRELWGPLIRKRRAHLPFWDQR